MEQKIIKKRKPLTEEHKKKLSLLKLGKKLSIEHRRKMSENRKGSKNPRYGKGDNIKGEKNPNFGNGKRIIGEKNPNYKGGRPKCIDCGLLLNSYQPKKCWECYKKTNIKESHHSWLGGISFIDYPYEWTDTLKQSIRIRDSYICQICGRIQSNLDKKQFPVHHIDYNKKNCNPKNLITLCNPCHIKTNYNRKSWINYFKQR